MAGAERNIAEFTVRQAQTFNQLSPKLFSVSKVSKCFAHLSSAVLTWPNYRRPTCGYTEVLTRALDCLESDFSPFFDKKTHISPVWFTIASSQVKEALSYH